MAIVTVTHCWPDGSITEVSVEVRESYPDALDQARATAVAALRDAVAGLGDEDA